MREAVFHHEDSSWYCSELIELYMCILLAYNGQLWRMGMIHVRV